MKKNFWLSIIVLLISLLLTALTSLNVKHEVDLKAQQEFNFICSDVKTKISSRLHSIALVLRSTSAFVTLNETITSKEWKEFYELEKLNKNLPGIQAVGLSMVINPLNIQRYNLELNSKQKIYSAVVYLEPLSEKNIKVLGYDAFQEPIRRKAMETARDSNLAILTNKIILKQDVGAKKLSGTVMFVPVYNKDLPITNLDERKKAITGWVFGSFRIDDFMNSIINKHDFFNLKKLRLQIYDNESIQLDALMFDIQTSKLKVLNNVFESKIPIEFNGKHWTLFFTQEYGDITYFYRRLILVILSGILISGLLFALTLTYLKTKYKAKQIEILNTQLNELNASKDKFISILAHDLKNPFNTLLGFSEMLLSEVRTLNIEEIESQVNTIFDASKKMYNLLDDLLMWAKLQRQKIPFKPQKIDLNCICCDVVEQIQFLANVKNINIQCLASNNIYLYADKNMLQTILRNLISNAIKFTKNEGKIHINAEINNNIVTVIVADNGIGIEQEEIKKLFNLAEFHSTQGTANEQGTGLGLLLCKSFVEIHKGNIWVESIKGEGSSFKFSMPMFKDNYEL